MSTTKVTVKTTTSIDTKKVWDFWTKPKHITKWNFASDNWYYPTAENDLRVGGKMKSRMVSLDHRKIFISIFKNYP
jgi:uncharacterized protein YndB with AHSA1/START domain